MPGSDYDEDERIQLIRKAIEGNHHHDHGHGNGW